jgi:hypothetical protein
MLPVVQKITLGTTGDLKTRRRMVSKTKGQTIGLKNTIQRSTICFVWVAVALALISNGSSRLLYATYFAPILAGACSFVKIIYFLIVDKFLLTGLQIAAITFA